MLFFISDILHVEYFRHFFVHDVLFDWRFFYYNIFKKSFLLSGSNARSRYRMFATISWLYECPIKEAPQNIVKPMWDIPLEFVYHD